jgi:two-component system, OmpR family, alkaline phosphatase synthesis response regulator PhoP
VTMSGNGRKVMVVEDDRDINELVCYNLRKEGFEAEPVFDGEEARRSLQNDDFDVVILDVMLPGMNGFSICRMIKESPGARKTGVIMLTAKNDIKDRLYGLFLGADYYVTKPFSVEVLMSLALDLSDKSTQRGGDDDLR